MLVTFDLDSTLADTRHRHSLILEDGSTDWQAYAMACASDALITACASLWRTLRPHHTLWVVSGRSMAAAALTARWLDAQGLDPDGVILMSADRDVRTVDHAQYKVECIQRAERMAGERLLFHVDDYPPVAKACAEAGYECLILASPQRLEAFDGRPSYI